MNSDGYLCGKCDNEIYQGQRFCDKCGYRLNHSIVGGKLSKGKIRRSSRNNVLHSIRKFVGCCGTNNEPVISDTKNRDVILQGEQNAEQDKWEQHEIDNDNAEGLSARNDIQSDTNLKDGNNCAKEPRDMESSIDNDFAARVEINNKHISVNRENYLDKTGLFARNDIHSDENLEIKHEGRQEPRDTECSTENCPSSKKDIQADDNILREHDGKQEPEESEISIENGSSSKKDKQTDANVLSEHDGKLDQGDADMHIENGHSSKKDIQTDENVPSEHDVIQEPRDAETCIENGSSSKKDKQTDANVLIEHDGKLDQEDADMHIENGHSSKKDIQTDENVPSEHDVIQEPRDTENCIENGHSSKKDIETDENVPSEHDVIQEPRDTETCIENGSSSKKGKQTDENVRIEHDRKPDQGDADMHIENGHSSKKDIQTDENVPSEHDVIQEQRDTETCIENGPSSKKDIQTDENVPSEHDVIQEPRDTETCIENDSSSKKDKQTDENMLSEHDGKQDQGDADMHIENGPSSKKDIQTDENVPSEHDVKQDPGDTKTSIENEATVSNQAQATKVEPTDIKNMLQEKLQKDGLKKTQEYIERVLNSHRQNPVRLAVSGRSHVGKSTFINTMRGSKKGDKSYAKSGHGNTTMEVTKYPHPENDMIIFYDLPGFGTLSMTKEKFLKQVNISDFDYFFIIFDSVLSEDDVWFVDQIKPSMTPFCLVRTKLDLTLTKDEAVEDTVIQNIRQSHLQSLEDHPDLQKKPLFIISSDQPHIGEMTLLIDYMKNSLSDAKWDAIIYFIPMITESVIQVKYEELCKRIPWAAFEASVISALPIPLLDIGLNMVVMKRELQCFIECFQLNSAEAKAVLGVNYRWGISDLNQFILTGLKAVINSGTVLATIGTSVLSQIDVFVPVIGSVVAGTITFQYVNFFLKRNLDQMKRDADIVFKHTLTKVCEKATSKADGI